MRGRIPGALLHRKVTKNCREGRKLDPAAETGGNPKSVKSEKRPPLVFSRKDKGEQALDLVRNRQLFGGDAFYLRLASRILVERKLPTALSGFLAPSLDTVVSHIVQLIDRDPSEHR
jgi:hypothetical protein